MEIDKGKSVVEMFGWLCHKIVRMESQRFLLRLLSWNVERYHRCGSTKDRQCAGGNDEQLVNLYLDRFAENVDCAAKFETVSTMTLRRQIFPNRSSALFPVPPMVENLAFVEASSFMSISQFQGILGGSGGRLLLIFS